MAIVRESGISKLLGRRQIVEKKNEEFGEF
jgi:hypothetical protein